MFITRCDCFTLERTLIALLKASILRNPLPINTYEIIILAVSTSNPLTCSHGNEHTSGVGVGKHWSTT